MRPTKQFQSKTMRKNQLHPIFFGKMRQKKPKKLWKLCSKKKLFHLKKIWGKSIFFLFILNKPLKVLKCPHSFHKRVEHYQKTPVLCFHGRKWFPLKCWLNNSRKVFLWGNKMLHTTVSHHNWKNIQRKIITLPLQHIDASPKLPFNVKLCCLFSEAISQRL